MGSRMLTTLPATASVDSVVECIDRDGGVIVEDMLSKETLDGLWADIGPYLEKTPFGEDGFAGARTRRCSALMAKSLHTAEALTQRHLYGAAERILPRPYTYTNSEERSQLLPTIQLCVTQALQLWPGQKAQVLHRDDFIHHTRHPGPETLVQVLYAASDFTAKNGGTLTIPGSHRWDDERVPRMEETVPTEMKRGSGLIYVGSLYHGGGANTTEDELRTAIAISYTLGYLRQEENQYLVVPREIVKKYPRRVQELMGYVASPPLCGWVEMQHPMALLENDSLEVAVAANLGS